MSSAPVNPARAGMILLSAGISMGLICKPRASGDDPYLYSILYTLYT